MQNLMDCKTQGPFSVKDSRQRQMFLWVATIIRRISCQKQINIAQVGVRKYKKRKERLCPEKKHRRTTPSPSCLQHGGVPMPLMTVWFQKQIYGRCLRR